ncbi:MAG: hypothetical protein ACRBEQ_13315 [Hyphomonas sp.]
MKLLRFLVSTAFVALPVSPAMAEMESHPAFQVFGLVVVWAADENSGVPIVSDFVIDSGNGVTAANSGDADLISTDAHAVVTGTLISTKDAVNSIGTMPFVITNTQQGDINTDTNSDGILNASDSFSAFGLLNNSDTRVDATTSRSSFYVASNVPFAIDAQATPPASMLDVTMLNIVRLNMSSQVAGDDGIAFGASAQAAHSAGPTGGFAPERRLIQFLTPRRIFTGNQRTASTDGSLADQSIRFDAEYSIRAQNLAGYDLSLGTFDFQVEMVYTVFVP